MTIDELIRMVNIALGLQTALPGDDPRLPGRRRDLRLRDHRRRHHQSGQQQPERLHDVRGLLARQAHDLLLLRRRASPREESRS